MSPESAGARWLVAIAASVSCSSPAKPARSGPSGPIVPAKLLTIADLQGAGATVTTISDTESLVCGDRCICIKDLDCTETECISYDDNIASFKQALARDTRTVSCKLADSGRLCDLSYFRFYGDIYRYEISYFGPDGRLVGRSNTTDFLEYCGGKAMRQFEGRVPDCAMTPWDVDVICADDRSRDEAGILVPARQLVLSP